jgi:hypothetical protein
MRRRAIAAAVIAIAAIAFYAPTIHDYFLQDDFGVVGLLSQRSISYFPRWFVAPWTENIWGYVPDEIRPFPALSYVMASWFGAAAPESNHILNIAIHALNGLLVMWIAEAAAGIGLFPAMVSGLIFVVLPIQAESVAWVTGRVDSLPTCFYLASFLLFVRWRHRARLPTYLWSVALFFAALFSKQNTITMAPALILFDWIVDRRRIEISWRWLRPYVPYVALTSAFLALRYVLFHEVARESILSAQRSSEFFSDSSRHLVRLVFGGPGLRHWTWRDTGWIAGIAFIIALADAKRQMLTTTVEKLRQSGDAVPRAFERVRMSIGPTWRAIVYFGLIWIVLGMAPILVSGYYSPRHMYLASLGWAVVLGAGLEMLWSSPPVATRRLLAGILAAVLLIGYGSQLRGVIREWNQYAAISRAASTQIEQEAAINPDGTLVIAGVPRLSWAFAVPHAVRPPFTPTDLTKRIFVISDSFDHCCNAVLWNEYTRSALRAWHDRPDHPPVVAVYWNPRTGRMSRVSDRDDPQLRTLVSLLMETKSRESLDSVIRGLLNDYVALR